MSSPAARAEALLAHAAREVPWWGDALAGRSAPTPPAMDRALIAERWEDLVAGRAVTRAQALAHYRADPAAPMPGGARVFLSAGARGEPVPLLYDAATWEAYVAAVRRALLAAGAPPGGTVALVGSDDPAHTVCRLARDLAPAGRSVAIGLQDGVAHACERLEALRPDAVYGIASATALLAQEGARITPAAVLTGTDALGEREREAIERAWDVQPRASYGLTELGLVAAECRFGGAMHVEEETVLLEQAPDGAVHGTGLVNRLQPIIRLRLPERLEFSREACTCGGSPLRLDLHSGRTAVAWRVPARRGGTTPLHPIVLRSALDPLALPQLPRVEWTGEQLRVAVSAGRAEEVSERLRAALRRAGVDDRILAIESPA